MNKLIFSQVMTECGTVRFNDLFDKFGLPVTIELEKNDDGIVITAERRDITETERLEICDRYGYCCDDCPLDGRLCNAGEDEGEDDEDG